MIYKVAPKIEDYFLEQYNKCGVRVVPGHWPEMRTKKDVDEWIESLKCLSNLTEMLKRRSQNGCTSGI